MQALIPDYLQPEDSLLAVQGLQSVLLASRPDAYRHVAGSATLLETLQGRVAPNPDGFPEQSFQLDVPGRPARFLSFAEAVTHP